MDSQGTFELSSVHRLHTVNGAVLKSSSCHVKPCTAWKEEPPHSGGGDYTSQSVKQAGL